MAKVFLTISGTSIPRVSLNEILDVDTSGGQDGYVLTQQADGTFALEQVAQSLEGLSDTQVGNAQSGNTLQYNGAYWVPVALSIPSGDIYYRNRYASEAETLLDGGAETLELYYTAQADGDGLHEDAQSDTPRSGYDIQRKLYYSEAAQADPDTGTWIQFTAIADNTSYASAKSTLLDYLKARTGGTVPISLKMTWEEVAQAPAFTGLLNESYGSGAAAAYSTRRLNGNVTECMVIRRASDSTTTTIGFDSNGNIDESAINTFCSGTTCTVQTWKDQSGNGNDATQATAANQPTIYTGGAIVKENGKVALELDGTSWFTALSGTTYNSPFTQFLTLKNTALTGIRMVSDATASSPRSPIYSNNGAWVLNSVTTDKYAPFRTLLSGISKTSLGSLRLDGTQTYTGNTGFGTNGLTLFGYFAGGSSPIGTAQEFLFYNSDKATDQSSIESNVGGYFTQNTPLLDTYTGAAAAYSLRKLRSAYSGSAIRVRRASDNAESDIGFNVFNELDTVSLAAFCSGTDGFVKTWYDQSGNANDITQTTAANQPKIYDSTTGVMTENGKPTVQFDGTNDVLTRTIPTNQVATMTAFSVHHITANKGYIYGWFNSSSNKANVISYEGTPAKYRFGWGASLIGVDTGNQLLFTGRQDGTSGLMNINGASQGSFTIDATRYWDGAFLIGKTVYSTSPEINISEYVMYHTAQSNENVSNIEDNINNFYSIY